MFFESEPLPPTFKAVSILWAFADLPEPVRNWILDLHYCSGLKKTADATVCFQNSTFVLEYLSGSKDLVISEISERLGPHGFEAGSTLSQWLDGFLAISQLASQAEKTCSWIAPVTKEEQEESSKVASRMLRFLDELEE